MKLRPLIKNKKGNILDIVYLPVLLFAIAVSLFIIYFVYTQIQTPLGDNLKTINPDVPDFLENVKGGLGTFDTMFPILLAGIILTMIISAYLIDSYPFLFFISTFLFVIAILFAAILANIHTDMIRDNAVFASVIGDWATTNWIINHLPVIICGVAVAVSVALFTKSPRGTTI